LGGGLFLNVPKKKKTWGPNCGRKKGPVAGRKAAVSVLGGEKKKGGDTALLEGVWEREPARTPGGGGLQGVEIFSWGGRLKFFEKGGGN